MFEEIQLLKENLDGESRGDHVQAVREKAASLIQLEDWKGAVDFFHEFYEVFNGNRSNLGIVKNEFSCLVDRLLGLLPDFETVLHLNRLKEFPWFDLITESYYKRGIISEHLSRHSQGGELIELRTARDYYRLAQCHDDVLRVQKIISEKARSFSLWAPIVPPDHIVAPFRQAVEKARQKWLDQADDDRLESLIYDGFGICPSRPDPQNTAGDVFSSGVLHQFGAIQTIEVSSDGRISSGRPALPFERNNYESWDYVHRIILDSLSADVKAWLLTQTGEYQVYGLISGTFRQFLNWDENSSQHFNEGLAGWISGFSQIALSFWIPYFEAALRLRLVDLGEDVVSPRERQGIEDFTTFEGLLTKALKHYDYSTVQYWRRIFSTENGLGWNLRHDFCHGLLPMQAMKSDSLSLATFFAYLFLLQRDQHHQPPQQEDSEAKS